MSSNAFLAEWTGLEPATPGVTGRCQFRGLARASGRFEFQKVVRFAQISPDSGNSDSKKLRRRRRPGRPLPTRSGPSSRRTGGGKAVTGPTSLRSALVDNTSSGLEGRKGVASVRWLHPSALDLPAVHGASTRCAARRRGVRGYGCTRPRAVRPSESAARRRCVRARSGMYHEARRLGTAPVQILQRSGRKMEYSVE